MQLAAHDHLALERRGSMEEGMNHNAIQFGLLLKESFFGLGVMAIVAVFNIYAFNEIAMAYRRPMKGRTFKGRYYEMFRFVAYTMLLGLALLMSLAFWVLALTFFDFVDDWVIALLFSASFFTTVGNYTVDLPVGWRLIPSIIAFSGLFSFAWATGSSISMARSLSDYLEKFKQI